MCVVVGVIMPVVVRMVMVVMRVLVRVMPGAIVIGPFRIG